MWHVGVILYLSMVTYASVRVREEEYGWGRRRKKMKVSATSRGAVYIYIYTSRRFGIALLCVGLGKLHLEKKRK